MEQNNHQQRAEAEPAAATAAASLPPGSTPEVTLAGTNAGPQVGPNPSVGVAQVPQPPEPPPVIHGAGEARPGEANPAAPLTTPTGQPPADTAQLLAAREAAEEAISAGVRHGQPGMAANPPVDTPYA